MPYKFCLASEITEPLHILIVLAGSSSCGKTYSALRIAKGLSGKPPVYIDTEARRALHYRRSFDFLHLDFSPFDPETGEFVGYAPERYIEVIDAAEKTDADVIVIDSFSHVWEGPGGVLESHARAVERLSGGDQSKAEKVSLLAWGEVKPRYRKLMHRLIQTRKHVIICIRAKPRVGEFRGGKIRYIGRSKIRMDDYGYDIAADKDIAFEVNASLMLSPEAGVGVPRPIKLPDELARAFPNNRPIDETCGEFLRRWSETAGREGAGDKSLIDRARDEARAGYDAVNAFWAGLTKSDQDIIRPFLAELKRISEDADRDDAAIPFDGGDDDGAEYERRVKEQAEREMAGGQMEVETRKDQA